MIREGKRLPANVKSNIPKLIREISNMPDVVAFYTFGSIIQGDLKPLSDLDFGLLLSLNLNHRMLGQRMIEAISICNDTLKTDEIDLIILNTAPRRFVYNIFSKGKLIYCRDQIQLIDFREHTLKCYLDFRPMREQFDQAFLKGVGYYG